MLLKTVTKELTNKAILNLKQDCMHYYVSLINIIMLIILSGDVYSSFLLIHSSLSNYVAKKARTVK